MIGDGAVPELRVGDRADLALQVWCWDRRCLPPDGHSLRLLDDADPQGHAGCVYELVGTARGANRWSDWVLDVHGILLAVRGGIEPGPAPGAGCRVYVHGTVAVAQGYEWEGLPAHGSRLWDVKEIEAEVRPYPRPADGGQLREGGPLERRSVDRIDDDVEEFGDYLIDIMPVGPSY